MLHFLDIVNHITVAKQTKRFSPVTNPHIRHENCHLNLKLSVSECHYNDVILSAKAAQITSVSIVFFNYLFRRRSKKTSKHPDTGICEGKSTGYRWFTSIRASNDKNGTIWWLHHVKLNQHVPIKLVNGNRFIRKSVTIFRAIVPI